MPADRSPARLCLFLDVDGSLIDIAPRPDAVVVPTSLVEDLEGAVAALGGAVALVSGRSIAQLDALFTPLRMRASGVHGAEIRFEPDGVVTRTAGDPIPNAVRSELGALLQAFPGTLVEDKVFSLAIHYRAVPDAAARLLDALAGLVTHHPDAGLVLLRGHFVVEVKGPSFDKGAAVRQFLAHPRFTGRTPVFVGDDVTDQPGFAAAIAAGGLAYGVGREIPGTTGTFANPSAVRTWVRAVANTESLPA